MTPQYVDCTAYPQWILEFESTTSTRAMIKVAGDQSKCLFWDGSKGGVVVGVCGAWSDGRGVWDLESARSL